MTSVIDIEVPTTEEDWLHKTVGKRNLGEILVIADRDSLSEIGHFNKRPAIPRGMRREVIHNSNGICCICRKKSKYLFLHHINGDRFDHKHDNLIALCTAHHDEVHTRNGYTKGISQILLRMYKRDWKTKVKKNRETKDKKQFGDVILTLTEVVLEEPVIIIDDKIAEHKWVTIPDKGAINVGGKGGGIAGKQIPVMNDATGKEKKKLEALNDMMIEHERKEDRDSLFNVDVVVTITDEGGN